MERNLLPLGSVVTLVEGEKKLMICGRMQIMEGSEEIYDYSACTYPEGILKPDEMYFFNNDAIENIYFLGYQDEEEFNFKEYLFQQLDELEASLDESVEE